MLYSVDATAFFTKGLFITRDFEGNVPLYTLVKYLPYIFLSSFHFTMHKRLTDYGLSARQKPNFQTCRFLLLQMNS